jgi:RimJ/RimL family protein N-acetyltransferase
MCLSRASVAAHSGLVAAPDFTRKPVLDGRLVRLVPATRDSVDHLWPLLADPEVGRLTGSVHSSAPDQPRRFNRGRLEDIYDSWSTADDRTVWVIEERGTGRVVGESVLNDVDVENLSCGFRIWISGATGRGLGTEATWLTVRHAFEEQRLHRVALEVYAFNPRARHVYDTVGFRHEAPCVTPSGSTTAGSTPTSWP